MDFDLTLFKPLLNDYENLIIFDFETTGLEAKQDDIIDIGLIKIDKDGRKDFSYLIQTDKEISKEVIELTHIDNVLLKNNGRPRIVVANLLEQIFSSKSSLLVGYNVNFDLGFLLEFAKKYGFQEKISNFDYLDIMTVFKDDKVDYPHKLSDAILFYKVRNVKNSHRAFDDTEATLAIMQEMLCIHNDFKKYINVFGYNPKYGNKLTRLQGIEYAPQPYNAHPKVYATVGVQNKRAEKSLFTDTSYDYQKSLKNKIDDDTCRLIYELAYSYHKQGEYNISFDAFQDIPFYSDANVLLNEAKSRLKTFVDEVKWQKYLAEKATIYKQYDEAYMRYRLFDFESAMKILSFMEYDDFMKDYILGKRKYQEFEKKLESKEFKDFLKTYPNFEDKRRKTIEDRFSRDRMIRTFNSDSNFAAGLNLFETYLSKEEKEFAAPIICNNFTAVVEAVGHQKILTQYLLNAIVNNEEKKKYFFKAFVDSYLDHYSPNNDFLKMFENYDIYDDYLEKASNQDIKNYQLSDLALIGKLKPKTNKARIAILKSHLYSYEFKPASELYKEEDEKMVKNIFAEIIPDMVSIFSPQKQHLLALIKHFRTFESYVLNIVYETNSKNYLKEIEKPEKNANANTDQEVLDFYKKKYNKDIEQYKRCEQDDLKEQNSFGNRLKSFFGSKVVIKTRRDAFVKKATAENAIYLIAIEYGFSMKAVQELRQKNGR